MSRAVLSTRCNALLLCHDRGMPSPEVPPDSPRPEGARARARAELTREIKAAARRHIATEGAAALSLRAVAREMGMVSSAIYRYFPSRDDLLTALLVEAYEDVADAAEAAERSSIRGGTTRRWLALSEAIRRWALDNPSSFDLVYGSPVPGYRAPEATIAPATRVSLVFLRIVVAGVAGGEIEVQSVLPVPRAVHADFGALRDLLSPGLDDQILSQALLVWTQLFGTLSFELHGHLHNVIHDYDAFFSLQMRRSAELLTASS